MLHSAHNQVNTANKKLTNWDSTSDLLLFRCMKNAKKTFNISQQQPGLSPWIHGASILDMRNTGSLIHVCSFLFSSFGSSALCPLQVQISALCWLEIISISNYFRNKQTTTSLPIPRRFMSPSASLGLEVECLYLQTLSKKCEYQGKVYLFP